MKELLSGVASQFLPIAYFALLGLAVLSTNPWIYHPLFFFLLLVPSISAFVFSARGRIPDAKNWIDRTSNALGTIGFVIPGLLFLASYVGAVLSKQ